ncbi:NAD-dependent epimerase/dehydratase family protein [Aspergillus puulaauensis]|uniref:NAD-dependent epimerase/dehydratase domain-containing protein n=1 Tax=Aspergillus puulaauensis TaxID=1220207 RepID=A0A7R7XXI0_9EURO|nr:uncharacterized protein APUU_70852S [Aspergillus puulaauensis]BCS29282.1 hypothetical protein APUU_70852S [Aspergillus puulaauensis]
MGRIIITGGSGKVGQYAIPVLLSHGHTILNLDIAPLPPHLSQKVHTLHVDPTDSGQVHSALTSPFHSPLNQIPDAVIHLAGIPRNMIVPDVETFRVNTQAGYNVIEAACRLGVKKIIIASTMCHLAVVRDGLGYQVFNATNDEITVDTEMTEAFLKKNAPGVVFTREMEGREAPLTNRKMKEMLGFRQEHPWQKYFAYA